MRILETRFLQWPDEVATQAFCALLAQGLQAHPRLMNASIELHGSLGAGKTSLVRHLLRALGVSGRIKSPSYAVLESYDLAAEAGLAQPNTGQPPSPLMSSVVSHFDFYRFDDPREWEDAGFRDIFAAPGLKLSEWPEKAQGMLPVPDLQIFLEAQADESRQVRLVAGTERGVEWIHLLGVMS